MVTNAVIELFLHSTKHKLRGADLSLFLLVISISTRVLFRFVRCLSDIHQARCQLLHLTAGDGHQEYVEAGVDEKYWEAVGSHEELMQR